MKKRHIKLLILLCMLIASLIRIIIYNENSSLAASNVELTIPTDYSNQFFVTQDRSVNIYNQLLNGFYDEAAPLNTLCMDDSEENNHIYPDYYGGAYINDEGDLVVLLTDLNLENETNMNSIAGTSLLYEECNVSYNEICDTIELLTAQIPIFEEQGVIIASIRDNIMDGCVDVEVVDLNVKKGETIRSVANYDFVRIVDGELTEDCSGMQIKGGCTILNKEKDGASSTLGFSAELNGVKGFVIVGHTCINPDNPYSFGSFTTNTDIPLGTVTAVSYYNGATADAAFIAASPMVTPTNYLMNGNIVVGTQKSLPVNTVVYSYGAVSGNRSGKITSINVSVNNGTYIFRNQSVANYKSELGDSGGPVYYYGGVSPKTECYIVGIHKGINENYSCFSTYGNIVNELGISCITK